MLIVARGIVDDVSFKTGAVTSSKYQCHNHSCRICPRPDFNQSKEQSQECLIRNITKEGFGVNPHTASFEDGDRSDMSTIIIQQQTGRDVGLCWVLLECNLVPKFFFLKTNQVS